MGNNTVLLEGTRRKELHFLNKRVGSEHKLVEELLDLFHFFAIWVKLRVAANDLQRKGLSLLTCVLVLQDVVVVKIGTDQGV